MSDSVNTIAIEALRAEIAALRSEVEALKRANVLWEKKWVACGDSLTEGDYSKAPYDNWRIEGTERGRKTYPYFIGQRNHMTIVNEALCGSTIALSKEYLEDPENNPIVTRRPFTLERYKRIPEDADYITLWFGTNDTAHTNLGTIADETNETFYGAWNFVLPYLIEHHPRCKIGIIINYGGGAEYRQAERDVARKWGIPFLDLNADEQVPLLFKPGNEIIDPGILKMRRNYFVVGPENGHPNLIAHEYLSTIVEAFLRRL